MTARDFLGLSIRAEWKATVLRSTTALWLLVLVCTGIAAQGADTPVATNGLLEHFKKPPDGYGPIDCWWWEAGRMSKERMCWQLEDLNAKGVSGTWYYPRFVYGEPLSSDPQYWTERWWDFTKFAAEEHRRLGLRDWFSDWTAHRFFQNKVFEDAKKEPSLQGRCLVIHEAQSSVDKATQIEIPENEEILDAAAFRQAAGVLDFASRNDLRDSIHDQKLSWNSGQAGWLVTVVTTTQENQAWTNENYTYGVNLYNRHGGLYETLGGWYEWVPPAVDHRQPYWKYWKHFADYITRLSYILSQGVQVSDVAILYPISTIHAHWSGGNNFGPPAKDAADSAVQLAQEIFYGGIDFNFIDDPSARRAEVRDGKLAVSGLEFRIFLYHTMVVFRLARRD